jgi:hypothetical protein
MDNDYELLYLAKDDDQVKDLIYQKYKNLIYYKARKYLQRNNTNNELEDYISEGTIALSEIIDNNQRTVYNIINRIRKKVSSIVSNKNNY